ncbi:class I SAM-dependent methyltransferase [uncultured Flavobacterium sp.]|uniref:class I SAM-dependent methyltransferase n=1 Tax=uncultured Flavobacterium sp. TaxID=165435 RepID=UPI0030CA1996
MTNKEHWENIFATKRENEVSWFQKTPVNSIEIIEKLNLSKDAKIIDVGGGDSYLIDALLDKGFTNLFLLDISLNAIEKVKSRLGDKATMVTYIVSNVLDYKPEITFDLWHDRASFHFLTDSTQIHKYADLVSNLIVSGGNLVIGTFSETGPLKCSGLNISQYNESKLNSVFESKFIKKTCFITDHKTPFNTLQNFIFCTFKKQDHVS